MSGHSKWSTIKRKKGAADAKRGQIFTKIIREIMIAARNGGGNPTHNPRLRLAMQSAKENSMPKENIERAIKKATGELEGVTYEDITYEGYGPAGVAVLVHVTTDNKNRTVPEIRHIFSKHNGRLVEGGGVAWIFVKKGLFQIPTSATTEDKLMEIAAEAGADDIETSGDYFEVTCPPEQFEPLRETLDAAKIAVEHVEITMQPKNTITIDNERDAETMINLMNALEEQDDVSSVSANFDIPPEILAKIAK